ncbi:tandem-95 repeat protein [Methanocella sp. MCL-LM]|uniref:tandem-95 repeat protein n=1 Tax=Methanocella sp. MCL-LM TaxID=3412035 RepID=UPI003C747375
MVKIFAVTIVLLGLLISSAGGSAGAVVAIPLPVADDFYTTAEDTALTIPAPGILANDTNAATVTPVVVTGPINGALTVHLNGSFRYMPKADYYGTDTFTYKTTDGVTESGIATVTLTIEGVNDVPVAADDDYSLAEDTPLNVADTSAGLLWNDGDVDGDPLSAIAATYPAHGTLTLDPDGTFTYTPDANYHGTDSFTYKANDGTADSGIATAFLTITPVADAPVASHDSYSTDEDTVLAAPAPGILANDYDADGDAITLAGHTEPAHGILELRANGSFGYTPEANFCGTDEFGYWISAGSMTAEPVKVTITVRPQNDAPVAGNDAYATVEDTPLSVTPASAGVLGNDVDLDSGSLAAIVVTSPTHGTLALNPDGTFTYNPGLNYHGTDSFTYKATDGSSDSGTAIVTLTISPANDAPAAADDAYRVDRNAVLWAAPGVLGNDVDVDGDTVTAALLSGTLHGTLDFYPNGTFRYTPDEGYLGTDSFTYKANDGALDSAAATVSLIVNMAPVASDNTYNINEDGTLTIAASGVLENDHDPDGSTLTAVLAEGPDHGTVTLHTDGSFVYAPWGNYHGQDWFTYRAYDGLEYSEPRTVTITVNSINDIPYAGDDAYWVDEDGSLNIQASGVLGNDADYDGDSISAYLASGTSHGSLTLYGNGSFSYKPSSNYNGQDSFTYRAGDGSANSTTATVRIYVNSVNDPVSVSSISHPAFPLEVGAPVKISLTFKDIDQGGPRTARIFWGDGEMDWARVSEDSGSGTITGEYAYKKPGNYQITVMVADGSDGLVTVDTGTFDVVAKKPNSVGDNNSTAGTATPVASPTATVSQAPSEQATPQSTTENTSPAGGWQSGILYLGIIGIAIVAVAGYLLLFRRKG